MAKSRILIVSDDASRRATLARWLLGAGYAVELAESPRRTREVMAGESLSLALMDQSLTAADAELADEIAERIKRVVLLAAPAKEDDATAEPSAQSGAALVWPCDELYLLNRVRSELESAPAITTQSGPQLLHFEGYTLDADARSCLDAMGHELTLTRAEFSLLLAFARQPGRVLSRDELTHVVAGRGAEPDDRSIDVLISRLRRKIEPDPKTPRLIVTMPGEGYKFTARTQAVATNAATAAPSLVSAAIPTAKNVVGGTAPTLSAEARGIAGEASSRPMFSPRALAPAVVILMAALGWVAWSNHSTSRQAAEATAAQPAMPGERRASAFKRMVESLQDDRYTWRTVERLAVESGVDETEAREILAEHLDQVVLGKSHDGKLIARLTIR